MFLRQCGNDWFVCRRRARGVGSVGRNSFRSWFLVKANINKTSECGTLVIGTLTLPKKFIGKRIRLKAEIIDDTTK